MDMKEKILGGLIGAGIGDTMGSATEAKPTQAILQRHGCYVHELRKAPPDTFSRINWRGAVTDDFSLVYLIGKAVINADGKIDGKLFEDILLEWSDLPQYFIQAGPTSRDMVLRLKGTIKENPKANLIARSDLTTNGTSMKASPLGMINPGNLDQAIQDTIYMCMPTHPSTIAISNGAAVACAVAEAMTEKATKESIIEAAVYGAHYGYERSKSVAFPASGAKLERRIRMAVDIALKYQYDYDKLLHEIADVIGTGFSGAESTAAMFGLFVAAKDPMDLIYMCVNAGADTDTVATMGGALYGTLVGASAFDPKYQKAIEENNFWDADFTKNFDLNWMADGMAKVAEKRRGV